MSRAAVTLAALSVGLVYLAKVEPNSQLNPYRTIEHLGEAALRCRTRR